MGAPIRIIRASKQTDYRQLYWGEWFEVLLAVKQKYDRCNFFRYPQSISPDPHHPYAHTEVKLAGLDQPILYEEYAPPTC